jgi:photosystem II stability/assembly factor-like uncharacterized protein
MNRATGYLLAAALSALAACSHEQTRPDPAHESEHGLIRPDAPEEWAQFESAKRVPAGAAGIPMDAYARATAQMARMGRHYPLHRSEAGGTEAKSTTLPAWEWLGPANQGGRTRTLAFDPRNPNRMFAGGVSGGVWITEDAGQNWSPRSDSAANINIGSLLIDPEAPDTIYAGTGELYRNSAQPYSAMWGQGILKSADGGLTFQQLPATANDNFRYVADLVLSPHDHQRLYAATNTGIWRSNDGGATFTQLLRPVDGANNPLYEGCTDLLIRPDQATDFVLASCASRSTDDRYYIPGTILPPACAGPCPAAIFVNPDAGGTGSFQSVLSETGMGRTTMDLAKSQPGTIYAVSASIVPGFDRDGNGTGDYNNGLHAVWRSTDGGLHWTARLRNNSSDALSTFLLSYADGFRAVACGFDSVNFIYGAGWYNEAIAVDPTNANVVWVAGMDIYRSDDGGATFGMASHWWENDNSPHMVHADQHYLRFHPNYDGVANRQLYVTNDGGVAVTDNATAPVSRGLDAACGPTVANEVPWRTITHGLGTLQFYSGAVTATGSMFLGGAQDNGTRQRFSGQPTDGWFHILGGDGATVAIDPRTAQRFYYAFQNVNLYRTDDGGSSNVRITSGLNDATIFIMPFILDPNLPDRLYAGGTRLWRTVNRGSSWQAASAAFGFQFTDRVSALAVAPNNPNRMLVGNQKAIFFNPNALASTDMTAWQSRSPRTGWVSSLAFDPLDSNVAYATYSTFGGVHVWRSADAGASWAPLDGTGNGQLPDLPVNSIAIDPANRTHLYLGTDLGVFASLDGGQHWAVENTGFANVITEWLAIAPGNATIAPQLFAFTYGRGAWRVPLADLDAQPAYQIGADTSGSWYDPSQSGHGWFIDTVDIGGTKSVLAAWYVYLNGEQRWLIGTGPVNGNRAEVQLFITKGGTFPPNFDPAAVVREPWGTVTLEFTDASHGNAAWTTSYPGYNNGSMPLVRLTQPATGPNESPNGTIAACHSGSWYDPAQSGHGLFVEVLGDPGTRSLLAVWYAYLDGAQRWLIGTGPVVGDHAAMDMVVTQGAGFPPAFDPATVQRVPWGTLTFQGIDANHARIDWNGLLPGYGSGGLDLTRLTSQYGRECP